ncbi:MAG: NUDIX hydrolase [Pseudarcicella sp.]|nr:NUDIX hydrolase [Pseudarcicella sp.]
MQKYSNFLRTRICGIASLDNKILLINHKGIVENESFWSFPGGGLAYGEDTKDALRREFKEECSLTISVGDFMFVNQHLQKPLHAIELYFEVKIESGKLTKGIDPEHKIQIIEEVKWMSFDEINLIAPKNKHAILNLCDSQKSLWALKGNFLS